MMRTSTDPAHAAQLQRQGKIQNGGIRKAVILGGGPNRIGQGVEFDYCCVQASFALREMGVTSVMVNSNPETVSTDYDTTDRLYFEPVTVRTFWPYAKRKTRTGSSCSSAGRPR